MQVDHLDAAQTQLQAAVTPGRISVGAAPGSTRGQTQGQAENLVSNDGDDLQDNQGQSWTSSSGSPVWLPTGAQLQSSSQTSVFAKGAQSCESSQQAARLGASPAPNTAAGAREA